MDDKRRSLRRRLLRTLGVAVGVLVAVLVAGLLYLRFADLSGYRSTAERLASDALGRRLTIAGAFEPRIGLLSRLVAEDVTLANPDWSDEPAMVHVDRLLVELRPLSFLFAPIRIHRIEIDGARVVLEVDERGRASWDFELEGEPTPEEAGPDDGEPILEVQDVRLEDVVVVYRDAERPSPLELALDRLTIHTSDDDLLELETVGRLGARELALAGKLGPLDALIRGTNVEHDLSARLGEMEVDLEGRIGRLSDLGGLVLDAGIHGPDVAILGELGVPVPGQGPFELELRARPADTGGCAFEARATLQAIAAEVEGTLDSPLDPREVEARISASGPDLQSLASVAGVENLPRERFDIGGHVRWAGFPVSFDPLEVRVGSDVLRANGVLGEPPEMLGTDFTLDVEIADASWIGPLAGIDLPAAPLLARGHLFREQGGLRFQSVEAELGATSLRLEGRLGDPPKHAGTDLKVQARGPDASAFGPLTGVDLPRQRFEVSGHLGEAERGIAVSGAALRLGGHVLNLDGVIGTDGALAGTRARVRLRGPDLSEIGRLAGIPDLPARAYSAEGGVSAGANAVSLDGMRLGIGDLSLSIDGRLATGPDLVGTDVALEASGADVSWIAALAGETGIPAWPYRVRGGLRVVEEGYELSSLSIALGEIEAEIDGVISGAETLRGTRLDVSARGARLAPIGSFLDGVSLPEDPFAIAGSLRIEDDVFVVGQGQVEIGDHRVEVDGTIARAEDLAGTDVVFSLGGPDLGDLGRKIAAAGVEDLPELPGRPFRLAGRVAVDDRAYRLEGIEGAVGSGTFGIDGRVGPLPDLVGTDVRVDASSDEPALLSALLGTDLPAGTLRVRGRAERLAEGGRFHDVTLDLGEYHGRVDGTLGEPPRFVGTNLRVEARGPSLETLGDLLGEPGLPDAPFDLSGRFDGDPERFSVPRIAVTVGNSEIEGWFAADLGGKPAIEGELTSPRIDLTQWREAERTTAQVPTGEPPPPASRPGKSERGRLLIPDDPLKLGFLDAADLNVRLDVAELILSEFTFRDFGLGLHLREGELLIAPVSASGRWGGTLTARLHLSPADEQYRLWVEAKMDDARLDLVESDLDPSKFPTFDLDLAIDSTGDTPHALAAAASGRVIAVVGEGVMDRSLVDLVVTDFLREILTALNPFGRREDRTKTELECAVLVVSLDRGVARIDPLAARTDRMTLVGGGRVDFHDEKLDLSWAAKPRKGVGLSASAITNPYIKLGGTLARPAIDVKPMEAVASTGVAVATGGLSILGKGLLDRITAGRKVCEQAIRKADALAGGGDGR